MIKSRLPSVFGPSLFVLLSVPALQLAACSGEGAGKDGNDGKPMPSAVAEAGGAAGAAGAGAAMDPAASPSTTEGPLATTPGAGATPVGTDPGAPPAMGMGMPSSQPQAGDQGTAPPPAMPAAAPHTSPKSVSIYDESKVVDFYVTFAPGDWDKMLNPGDLKEDARWVHCGFSFEGEAFPDAACRRKGDVTDWVVERKPQFLVRFNLWNPKGRFRGLRRLHFESFDALEAPIRDRIGMSVMRQAGIDAPRVNHARVFKDGVQLGLYMNVEVIDKEFLEDHYGQPNSDGNLWKSGYELHTNETAPPNGKIEALQTLIETEALGTDHTTFAQILATQMDVSEVIRETAVETVLLVNDNFSNGSTNFYYYEHAARGFVALPWDLDTTFTQSPADADPFEYWAGSTPNKLRQIINETPALRAQYIDALVDVRDKVLTQLPAEVDRVCAQIRPFMPEEPTRAADLAQFEADCTQVAASITARSQALVRLLGR